MRLINRQRKKIKDAFVSLDSQNLGHVKREDIEDILIGLGIVSTTQEVNDIMDLIDTDKSNTIEFQEFFDVFKSKNISEKSLIIFNAITSISFV